MITLITDFQGSWYVGAMKGVIYNRNPRAVVVDVTHGIRAFDIRQAAYALHTIYHLFPEGTVHVVVVDPGVGTRRRGVIVESDGHFMVGPDNGVFSLIKPENVYTINERGDSSTFHGRDVFAPAASMLDSGTPPEELGSLGGELVRIMTLDVKEGYTLRGEVFCQDTFGNIITSIRDFHLEKAGITSGSTYKMQVGRRRLEVALEKTYGELPPDMLGALVNSSGYLEIVKREGSAGERVEAWGGESVEVYP